jgi:ectoine hydroxylase-related dioxygenase (phytanoyl-CoA dioxygenase family)
MTSTWNPGGAAELDVAAVGREVTENGYCVIPDVLDADLLGRARDALDRLVAEDVASGRALLYGPKLTNRRVHGILQRDDVFVELALNPVALAVARQVLGYDEVQLSVISANITGPGGDEGIGMLHADQMFLPGFFPTPFICNTAFFLDDYTEENGATVFVPGSNRQESMPPAEMPPRSELGAITGPAGSLGVWDGFLHHATGLNRTVDQYRRGIITTYFPPFLRSQHNWTRTLSPEWVAERPGLAAITGFEEWRSLGMDYTGDLETTYLNL